MQACPVASAVDMQLVSVGTDGKLRAVSVPRVAAHTIYGRVESYFFHVKIDALILIY